MILKDSLNSVANSNFSTFGDTNYCAPLYDSYCFSQIPTLIKSALVPENSHNLAPDLVQSLNLKNKVKDVVFIFVDSFGWRFFEEYQDEIPCMRLLKENALCTKLTSMFPSTTTAHVTTFNTNQMVGEHGLYEWYIYEKNFGEVVCPLLYSKREPQERNNLKNTEFSPENIFFHDDNFYTDLANFGISSYIIAPKDHKGSSYNNFMNQGAENVYYSNLTDGLSKLKTQLEQISSNNRLLYFYYGDIDSTAHKHGPLSNEHLNACKTFFNQFEKEILPLLENNDETLLLISADHGQRKVSLENTIFLNSYCPEILPMLETGKNNNPITHVGSPVDSFLHVKPDLIDDAHNLLNSKLKGIASVYKTEELIELGLFGPKVSNLFRDLIGDLLILPTEPYSVWWGDGKDPKAAYKGNHGGLSRIEMEIPLFTL